MRIIFQVLFLFFIVYTFSAGLADFQENEISLRSLTPENYAYTDAQGCSNCKGDENRFMLRAVGVDLTSGVAVLDERGWLASLHSRSQSHGDRVNTACAWCHAPTAAGATCDKNKAKPIPKGTWQGVTCAACHPGSLESSKRASLVINFTPGTDPTKPESYTFRNRADGKEMNAQCRFCHHESHDLLIEGKQKMMQAGDLRCIDCHMAAYAITGQHIERFHNFKVKANLPHSCSGGTGRAMSCHSGAPKEWFEKKLSLVKGPRKDWSSS